MNGNISFANVNDYRSRGDNRHGETLYIPLLAEEGWPKAGVVSSAETFRRSSIEASPCRARASRPHRRGRGMLLLLPSVGVSDARQELAHACIRHDLKDSQFGLLPRI